LRKFEQRLKEYKKNLLRKGDESTPYTAKAYSADTVKDCKGCIDIPRLTETTIFEKKKKSLLYTVE
jgi:hypothetical protein